MRRCSSIVFAGSLAFGVFALVCATSEAEEAQQSNAPTFSQTYESLAAKAREDCKTLWSDHVFDPLRGKLALTEDKPTFSMLTNKEKLRAKDKPLADLAIKTVEKCRSAYAPVFAMLPPQVNVVMQGVLQRQDALIAELYNGKITFGDYNVAMSRLKGELVETLSGIATPPESAAATQATEKAAASPPPI